MTAASKPHRPSRRGISRRRTNAEMVMASSALRNRIFRQAAPAALYRLLRVCSLWFHEAVPILYETVDLIHLVDMMDASSYSGIFLPYLNSVKRITQTVNFHPPKKANIVASDIDDDDPSLFPFLPVEVPSLICAVNFRPTLFPSLRAMIVDLPLGFEWGQGVLRRGGDRAVMTLNKAAETGERMLYVERSIGIYRNFLALDAELQGPIVPGFNTKLVYSILAEGKYMMSGNSTSTLPGTVLASLRKIQHPIRTLVIKGIDIQASQIVTLLAKSIPMPWPSEFDRLDRDIICDQVTGMGLAEFRAVARSPGIRGAPLVHLTSSGAPSAGAYLKPSDIYKIRDVVLQHLPDLKDLALSLVVDDDYETSYTDHLLSDPPPGPLDFLHVTIHPLQRAASSSKAKRPAPSKTAFPLNLIRRLASLISVRGRLTLAGVDILDVESVMPKGSSEIAAGVDVTEIIDWIRQQDEDLRQKMWTMDYMALGITRHLQLKSICYDFGSPLPFIHSLAHAFCAEVGETAMKYLSNLSLSLPNHDPGHTQCCSRDKMRKYTTLLDIRTRATDLDTLVVESHLLGIKEDVNTIGLLAMQLLVDLVKVGVKGTRETTDALMKKYPELFEGVRKMSKQAITAKAHAVKARFIKKT